MSRATLAISNVRGVNGPGKASDVLAAVRVSQPGITRVSNSPASPSGAGDRQVSSGTSFDIRSSGSSTFGLLINSATSGTPSTAVLYNNAPGNFSGTLGEGVTSSIPAISLSQEDGQLLVAALLGAAGTVHSGAGNGYALLDGTSMATPHVSGVAAAVWSRVPSASNQDIREALTATAQDLGAAGRDNTFGFGLVKAQAALDFLLGGGGGECLPADAACSVGTDCCSGVCSGKGNKKKCL